MGITRRMTKRHGPVYEVRLRDALGQEYSRTFRTKKDAERFEATQRADRWRGNWIDPRRASDRLRDVAEEWLVSHPNKKPSSLARDRSALDSQILPALGGVAVGQITQADVQRLVRVWSGRCAPRTVRRYYAVLRAIMNFAVDTDRIGRSPCRRIKLPEEPPVDHHIVSPEELARLAAAMDDGTAPMVYLAAVLGLRWGECAGLRVGGVDFLNKTLTVDRQLTRGINGKMVEGGPKWQSNRVMAMPDELIELLAEHLRARDLTGGDPDAYVFASPDGEPLHYSNWRQRVWLPALKAAGLEGLTFHALRTANTTAMVALGVDVKTAQTRAGHKQASTTLNIYARPTVTADRMAAERLGEHFLRTTRPTDEPQSS